MRHTFNSCVHAPAFQMELTDLRRAVCFNSARALGSLVAAPHPYPVHNGLKVVFICEHSKSLCRIRAGRHFYGAENEIWTDFGSVGNTEKNVFGRL